jgi:hypothetical protein
MSVASSLPFLHICHKDNSVLAIVDAYWNETYARRASRIKAYSRSLVGKLGVLPSNTNPASCLCTPIPGF